MLKIWFEIYALWNDMNCIRYEMWNSDMSWSWKWVFVESAIDVNLGSDWNMRADPVTIWHGVCWVITGRVRSHLQHNWQLSMNLAKGRSRNRCSETERLWPHWLSYFSFHLLADNEPPLTAFLLNTLNIDAVTFIYFT